MTRPVLAPQAPKPAYRDSLPALGCTCGGAVQASLRLFPDMPDRVIVARRWRCYDCYKLRRYQGYQRFRKMVKSLLQAEMHRTGLWEAEYCWRHMRMLTLSVNSDRYMGVVTRKMAARGIGVEGRTLVYSPMAMRLFLDHLQEKLDNMFRGRGRYSKGGAGKCIYWMQVEPQGPKAGWRLHVHVLLFGCPVEGLEWVGPSAKFRDAPVSRAQWLLEISAGESSEFARWLLGTGFWGTSDCRRVDSLDAAMDYVTKEMNTADVEGDVTADLLDWIFTDKAIGRRIKCVRYSSEFNAPGPEGAERYYVKAPLHKLKAFLPEMPAVEQGPLLPAEMYGGMRRQVTKIDMAKLRACDGFEIAEAIEADLSAERLSQRFRKRRDELLWTKVTDKRGTVRGRWMTPEVWVLERAKRRRRRRAIFLRNKAGVPPWLFVQRSLMRSELVARRC